MSDILKRDVEITYHAKLRFFERVFKQDMEEVERRILPDSVIDAWRIGGDGYYPVGDTHVLRIVNGSVVTVLPPQSITKKRPRLNVPQDGARARKMPRRRERGDRAKPDIDAGYLSDR